MALPFAPVGQIKNPWLQINKKKRKIIFQTNRKKFNDSPIIGRHIGLMLIQQNSDMKFGMFMAQKSMLREAIIEAKQGNQNLKLMFTLER